MHKYILNLLLLFLLISCNDNSKVSESVKLETWEDSVSYCIGTDLGNTFKIRGIDYKPDEFKKGFAETIKMDSSYAFGASLAANLILKGISVNPNNLLIGFDQVGKGDSLIFSENEKQAILMKFDQLMREEMTKKHQRKLDNQNLNGIAYIKKYKEDHEDAIETESGLIYRVLKEGYGENPKINDKVIVSYKGMLTDGTIFDSTIESGEPATFTVSGLIKGWQEALTMMKVGSKWELVVPSILGYGEKSQGNIPGMSTLIFELELLGIE